MSALLKSVVGATGNIAVPDASGDGSALPPPDKAPTENWDTNLNKYAQQDGNDSGNYDNQEEFTDAPSSGAIVKTFDEIMAETSTPVPDEVLEASAARLESPGAAVVSGRPGAVQSNERALELVEVGVEVADIGVIPFNYADAHWDDNFLALTIHPDHKTINFKPATKDNIKSMTFIMEKLGKKFTVIPLCQRLNSCTKSGLPMQLFRVKALESIEVESG